MAEVEGTKMGDYAEEGSESHHYPHVYKNESNSEEEEGSEHHPYVYKNGGNSEQLASAPPMEVIVHKTNLIHEQEEELEVSHNLDQKVPPLPAQGPAMVNTAMTFQHEKRERRIRVANLVLRGAGALFSFISFVIMASDDHGSNGRGSHVYLSYNDPPSNDYPPFNDYPPSNYDYPTFNDNPPLQDRSSDYYLSFDKFEAYRYCLAMGVIAFVYLLYQLGKGIFQTFFKPNSFRHVAFFYVDFIGDQILAYLLMSSSSTAASLTRSLQQLGFRGRMIDLPAASLSMSFIAFAVVAASSVLSSFALVKRILW
ncbi:hypothetical protein SUGI_0462100 [Cryptomeria japonica]|nr:hypothetical protein SUGI_0462100 [Cryptomeria japonica]